MAYRPCPVLSKSTKPGPISVLFSSPEIFQHTRQNFRDPGPTRQPLPVARGTRRRRGAAFAAKAPASITDLIRLKPSRSRPELPAAASRGSPRSRARRRCTAVIRNWRTNSAGSARSRDCPASPSTRARAVRTTAASSPPPLPANTPATPGANSSGEPPARGARPRPARAASQPRAATSCPRGPQVLSHLPGNPEGRQRLPLPRGLGQGRQVPAHYFPGTPLSSGRGRQIPGGRALG